MRLVGFLHFENSLEFAKAVKAKFLRKTHNGRARDAAFLCELMNGDMACKVPVLQDIFPDDHVCIIKVLSMGVDEFIESHALFPLGYFFFRLYLL
jgi:hypothetical protein